MKASLSSKKKNVCVILGSKKYPLLPRSKEWYYTRLKAWCEEKTENYAFIMHDKDLDEDGKTKFLHIHMALIMLPTSKDKKGHATYKMLSTILNELAKEVEIDGMSIQIDEMTSENGSIQYLIHKRNPEKAQYDEGEVVSSYTKEELHTIMESEIDTLSVTYLISVVKQCKSNRIEIMQQIGLKPYKEYRLVIADIIQDLRAMRFKELVNNGVVDDVEIIRTA